MTAWIIYFRQAAEYNRQYINFYTEEGAKLGIDFKLILVEDLEFGVRNNSWFIRYQKAKLDYPDFVICRAIYPLLSKQLELMGIRVFNNSFVAEICNDKARTYQYLAKTGITMVDTSFYRSFQFDEIMSRIDGATVVKAVEGHGGSQVFLINPDDADAYNNKTRQDGNESINNNHIPTNQANENYISTTHGCTCNDEALKKIGDIKKALKGSDLVVQPRIGSRNQDLRVYVIGKDIIAAVLRTAKEGFKSNFSLGGEVRLYELNEQEKALVNLIINQFNFGLVGIDFIIGDNGELIFNEIEDVVGSRMLYKCSDINIVQRYLIYILNNIGR
jgi:gamma-F420-2:alpha-L-glutamate ligase